MNKFFKKLAVVLSFVLVFAAMPMSVFAATTIGATSGNVTLTDNVDLSSMHTFTGDTVLDLAGYTISAASGNAIQITNGTLTVKDSVGGGKITAPNGQGIRVGENGVASKAGSLILESGTVEGIWGVTVWADSTVTVNGGTINATGIGISGNGNVGANGNGGTTVTINGGSINAGTGVYHPQAGTMTVNGGTITGTASGIEMRAGNLTVNAGTITGGNTYAVPASNGNGTTTSGVAVAVAPHTTGQAVSATINGGTLTAAKSVAEVNPEAGQVVPTVSISGGTHNGAVETTQTSGIITGGTFTTAPSENAVAPGYGSVSENGAFVVRVPGEAAPASGEHVWGYNPQYDAAAHWDYCYVCGAQNTPVAHSDANGDGVCDCGWVLANTPSRVNPNTGVTADMLK